MNLSRLAPLLALVALAACAGEADEELQNEGLSAEDVAAAPVDFAVPLAPGQYRTTSELIDFSMPSLSEEARRTAAAAFAQGAGEGHTYCLAAGATSDQWLSSMNESACTVSRLEEGEGRIDAVLQCSDPTGLNGRVEMSGTMAQTSADMELRFAQAIAQFGEGTIRMRVVSQRIGDCV